MPITFEEAEKGQVDDIRHIRDIVDLEFTRGCSKNTWRSTDGRGRAPASMDPDDKACSMNLYQNYYGKEDLQHELMHGNEKRVKNENDRSSAKSFEVDSNVFRRGHTVANEKAEYYVSGCIGGDFNVGGKLNDTGAAAPGFFNYTEVAGFMEGEGKMCSERSGNDCTGKDNRCIQDGIKGKCKAGLHDGASHSIGNLYFGDNEKKGPHDTYVRSSSKFCDRDNSGNPQVARHYVRKDYKGDKGDDGADNEWMTRRACCLGAGTFQDGQKVEGEYKAKHGLRPMGAPCKTDDDCWDGQPGGTMFCHTEPTFFYKGSKESVPNRDEVKLKSVKHPATFTCKRRCGAAGKVSEGHTGNKGKFEDVKFDYGTTWIGTFMGDQKTVDDAKLRSGLAMTLGPALTIFTGGLSNLAIPIAEAENERFIGSVEKKPELYAESSNLNAFECGFQQRVAKKPGETLYYKPVFQRADRHNDEVDHFLCLDSGKKFEYNNVGPSACYGHEREDGNFCVEKCGLGKGLETGWERSENPDFWKADGEYPTEQSMGFCQDTPDAIVATKNGKEACEKRGQEWVFTENGDSLSKSEYTDFHNGECKEQCLADEYVSAGGNKCMKNCSVGPVVKIRNGHIQFDEFEELTHCPFGYDSNQSDAFWNKVFEAKERCAAIDQQGLCELEKQERGKEDEDAKKACGKCLESKGESLTEYTQENIDACGTKCSRFGDIPSLCEWKEDSSAEGGGSCRFRSMKTYTDLYKVHNDFLSASKNPDTGKRGDGATDIRFENERCFYSGYPDQCWQAVNEVDAHGVAEKRKANLSGASFDPKQHRQKDALFGMYMEDRKCLPGWEETFPGVCAKSCTMTYRRGLKEVEAFCAEDESIEDEKKCNDAGHTWTVAKKWIDDQTGGIVGYGYSHKNCPDCVGVDPEDEAAMRACKERCNYAQLLDCPTKNEDSCQVPGTGCRWNAVKNQCYDPSYSIEHQSTWFGLLCTEKCGTSVHHGYHDPNKNKKEGFCDDKSKCTQPGTLNRCYQPCAADEKQGVFDFLCQDSCEKHMQEDSGMCLVRNTNVANDAKPIATKAIDDGTAAGVLTAAGAVFMGNPVVAIAAKKAGELIFKSTDEKEAVYRPAETTFYKCSSNNQTFWNETACIDACDASCSSLNGKSAISMNRIQDEMRESLLEKAKNKAQSMSKTEIADLNDTYPYFCESKNEFFESEATCQSACDNQQCEIHMFQCRATKEGFDTMGECKSQCEISNSCTRKPRNDVLSEMARTSSRSIEQALAEEEKKQNEEMKKDANQKLELEDQVQSMLDDRDREAELKSREEDAKRTTNAKSLEKIAKDAEKDANKKSKRPDRPSGGEFKSGFGCASNGDNNRKAWFRNYRRVRQIGGICWENAPDECTKCENLIFGGAKTACPDTELLAADACQRGKEEIVRMERLTNNVCGRVLTWVDLEKGSRPTFERKYENKCREFPMCRFDKNEDSDTYKECVAKDDFTFSVGDDVIVASGVSWREKWTTIQDEEKQKDKNMKSKFGEHANLMKSDEHIQGHNRVKGISQLREAVVVEAPFTHNGQKLVKIKFNDGKFAQHGETVGLKKCIDDKKNSFKVDGCCNCDMGLWNDVTCADALESNAVNWAGDSWKKNVKSWNYDGVLCKMRCPPNSEVGGFYCNVDCDTIVQETIDFCATKTGKNDKECNAHLFAGRDGKAIHKVCRKKGGSNNQCESSLKTQSKQRWESGIIPGSCYRRGPVHTRNRGSKNYGWFGEDKCNEDNEGNCQPTIIGWMPKCSHMFGEGYHSGFAPDLCFRNNTPNEFSAASLGSAVPIAQWYPTQGKRVFVPQTHVKSSYAPLSWMPSTYPKMRMKPSFFPVQRPRRGYTPASRVKESSTDENYWLGRDRNARFWDKQQTDSASDKACFQGCSDAIGLGNITEEQCSLHEQVCGKCCKGSGTRSMIQEGERDSRKTKLPDDTCGEDSVKGVWDGEKCTFPGAEEDAPLYGPRGCFTVKKETDESIFNSAKEKGGYSFPPLCRAHWTPGKPNHMGLVKPIKCSKDDKVYDSFEQCEKSCERTVTGLFSSESNCQVVTDNEEMKKIATQRWAQDCGEFFVGKKKVDAETKKEKGGWCMEFVEESMRVAFDGICMGDNMKAPEGETENVYCQTSQANCNACGGIWHSNMKEIAADGIVGNTKLFPEISGLGDVVGYTRNDKNVLLLPFSLPQGVRVGQDDSGNPVLRQILLTIDDGDRKKVFQVADRSLAYDRKEATSCNADVTLGGTSPLSNKTEDECRQICNDDEECEAFEWSVRNTCRIFGKNVKREEDPTMSNVCSIMKPNPHLSKNAMGEAIGYSVRIAPTKGFESLENELNLFDVKDDVESVPVPMPYMKNPGKPQKIGIMGTKNSFKMRRYQASSLLGGDICRSWLLGKDGKGETILSSDEVSPLYKFACDEYKEDCLSGDCSLLNSAVEFCNTRVDSARASSDLEVQLRLEKEKNFHTFQNGKCSDPSIKSKGICESTRRSASDTVREGQDNANQLKEWRSQQMLEEIPRCLPDTFSTFSLPARSCPRWTADGAQGDFCRQIKEKYPLQYDKAIHSFCKNPDNALLPACDCLSADVIATERKSNDKRSLDFCAASSGSQKADNYLERTKFCKTKQMLSSGSDTLVEGAINDHKFQFYDRCQATLDTPHILKPKMILSDDTMTCRKEAMDSLSNACGVKQSGCVAQGPMPNLCVNVVNQTIDNCVISKGDGPCAVMDSISQSNNCCDEQSETCQEISVRRQAIGNKVLLDPDVEAQRRMAPILEDSDGIYMCNDSAAALFTSKEECDAECDVDCVQQYQKHAGSSFATALLSDLAYSYDPSIEDPALTAAKKCAETENCTGFVFQKPENAGDWLQYTLLTSSSTSDLKPKYGATAFTLR